jgi:hypothetical protein
MTPPPEGMKVFDKEDKAAFLHEKRLVDDWLKKHQKMGQHIPKEWIEQLQKKKVDTLPPKALEQKSEYIRQGIADKEIRDPFIFLKNLNKIINYVKDMPNPTSHGFRQDLSEYSNDITPKIRKMNKGDILHLPKETQIKFLNTAEKLIDNGTLLRYMDDWYNEKEIQPAQRPIRKSLASIIRAFCLEL